jgi:hypothetical protein
MAACHPESSRISAASQSQLPRSELDRQPIEDSNLSGSHVTSSSPGESEQRLKRIRRVVRGTARKADGIERSKDEVAQQASIRLRGPERLRFVHPRRAGSTGTHSCAAVLRAAVPAESLGKGASHGDCVATQLMRRARFEQPLAFRCWRSCNTPMASARSPGRRIRSTAGIICAAPGLPRR